MKRAGLAFLALEGARRLRGVRPQPGYSAFRQGMEACPAMGRVRHDAAALPIDRRAIRARRNRRGRTGDGVWGASWRTTSWGFRWRRYTASMEQDPQHRIALRVMLPPWRFPIGCRGSPSVCQLWIADRFFVDPGAAPEVNAFPSRIGLPPVRRVVADWWYSPQRVIGLFPAWYCPPQPDWPPQVVPTGFPLVGLSERDCWISSAGEDFWRQAPAGALHGRQRVTAFAGPFDPGGPGMLPAVGMPRGSSSTKYRYQVPQDLPAGVRCFDYVPFGYLLPRSAARVCHGGSRHHGYWGWRRAFRRCSCPCCSTSRTTPRGWPGWAVESPCGAGRFADVPWPGCSPPVVTRDNATLPRVVGPAGPVAGDRSHLRFPLEKLLGTDSRRRTLGGAKHAVCEPATPAAPLTNRQSAA